LEDFVDSPELAGEEKKDFVEFVESMLKMSPKERPSARQLLEAKWLLKECRGNA